MPDHGRQLTGPEVRIGTREREAALTALGEHLTAGRLDLDEYGERSALATHAQTRGDLTALFADLPAPHPELAAGPGALHGGGKAEVATHPGAAVPGVTPASSVPTGPSGAAVPAVPGDRSPAEHTPARRALAAALAVLWAVGVPLVFILSLPWWLVFVPLAVSVFAGRYLGGDWQDEGSGRRPRRPR